MSKYLSIYRILVFSIIISLFTVITFPNELSAQTKEETDQFYYIEGLRQYNIGSLDEAQKIFLELIKKGTKNDAVYYYSSNIHLQKGDLKKAEESMLSALKLDPENYWYSIHLAKIYGAQNNLDSAIKIYEELRNKYPQKTDLYDDMIDIYIEQKQIDKARKVVDDVERYVGKNEATGLTRYNFLIYENKKQEAFEYLKDFDKENSTPRTSTLLGDYYSGKQKDTAALFYYNKALSLDPTYVPASFGMAEIYRMRRQFDLYFERVYPFLANPDIDPKMKVSYMTEIISSQKFVQTFKPQVDTMMNNIYTAHPSDSSVAYAYALYLVQTGRNDTGLKVLDKNLRLNIDSKEAHKQYLSLLYVRLGQSSTTLSGGESQRVKLAAELSKRDTGNSLYLLDEPTTGLHFEDIKVLLGVLQRLVDQGNTVLIIEHNLDVLRSVDYIFDLGPDGGAKGGWIVAQGTPEQLRLSPESVTGLYL